MTTLPSPQFATPSSTDSSNAAATTEFVNQFMAGLRTVTPVAATTAKQTTFTIPNGYNPGFINVYLNGLFLIGGTDYNGTGGEVITLSTTAAANVVVGSELVVENFAPLGASDTSEYFPKSGGTITGGVTVTGILTMSGGTVSITPPTTDNSTSVATTAYVQNVIAGITPGGDEDLSDYLTKEDASTTYLALTGGTITGTLKAPTPASTDNSTNVATTEFVKTALSNITPEGDMSDYLKIADAETTYLALTGGTITGTLRAVTPPQTDDSTNVATTSFVQTLVSNSTSDVDLSAYLKSSVAEETYATITSLSDYLLSANAETTYFPLTGGNISGITVISPPSGGNASNLYFKSGTSTTDSTTGDVTYTYGNSTIDFQTIGDGSTNTGRIQVAYGTAGTQFSGHMYYSAAEHTFVGSVAAPTPTAGDNSTNVATTAFVQKALSGTSSAPVDPSYTVSKLPATPVVGERAFATNGCKPGEPTGSGTGVPVFYDGTNWCSYCSGTTVTS